MITTQTVIQVCRKEEEHEHFQRRELLDSWLEAGRWSAVEEEFGCAMHDAVQLACEAIKFHSMRLDGHDFDAAIQRMVCPQFA